VHGAPISGLPEIGIEYVSGLPEIGIEYAHVGRARHACAFAHPTGLRIKKPIAGKPEIGAQFSVSHFANKRFEKGPQE
jgi:hypothetical protein